MAHDYQVIEDVITLKPHPAFFITEATVKNDSITLTVSHVIGNDDERPDYKEIAEWFLRELTIKE